MIAHQVQLAALTFMGRLTPMRGDLRDINHSVKKVAEWSTVVESLVWTDQDEKIATLNLGRSRSE